MITENEVCGFRYNNNLVPWLLQKILYRDYLSCPSQRLIRKCQEEEAKGHYYPWVFHRKKEILAKIANMWLL